MKKLKYKVIAGRTFSYLKVLRIPEHSRADALVECVCRCGNKCTPTIEKLVNRKTKSCGCLRRETLSKIGKKNCTHGMHNTPTYKSYWSMLERCYNPKKDNFHNYGGRGIKVCSRWLDSFSYFLADLGKRPKGKYSIERRNNNGNYCPENCYWTTIKNQRNNSRQNHFLTIDGTTRTMTQWAELNGIYPQLIYQRLKRGWTVEEAIKT